MDEIKKIEKKNKNEHNKQSAINLTHNKNFISTKYELGQFAKHFKAKYCHIY